MADDPSVTTWIALLRQGQSEAAEQLWQRYFARLVEFARGKLRGMSRAAADEEDVALSAFHSFCRAAERYPRLDNRLDLWRLLVTMTAHKAFQERRRQFTLKRGGPGDTGLPTSPTSAADLLELDEIIGTEPSPDFAVLVAEHYQTLLDRLPDDGLRLIARLRIEEATNAEIAAKLGCSERTVERRLALIRGYWEESL